MPRSRDLTVEEAKKASFLFMKGISVKQLAKHFNVNKPTVLKVLGIWDSETKTTSDGTKYKVIRGKVNVLEKPAEKETKHE